MPTGPVTKFTGFLATRHSRRRDARLVDVKRIELRSPLARAVVPVLAGIAFFVVLGLLLWLFAALIADNDDQVTNLAPDQFEVGPVEAIMGIVEEDGPILFPGLGPDNTDRLVVLNHSGGDPLSGWQVYMGHPADRPASCIVTQVPSTSSFVDCDGRTLDVTDLAPPALGVNPVIPDRKTLWLDLTPDESTDGAADTVAPTATDG